MSGLTVVHIVRRYIEDNTADGGDRPTFVVKYGDGRTRLAKQVDILGPSSLKFDAVNPMRGARAWIETESEVVLTDEMTMMDMAESETR